MNNFILFIIFLEYTFTTFVQQVLGDDDKRREYDTFGTTSSQMGGDPGFGGASAGSPFGGGFHYQTQVDPEELFRKIFGDFRTQYGSSNASDFAESQFGFGAAEEVRLRPVKACVIDT